MTFRAIALSVGLFLTASACAPPGLESYKPKDQEEAFIVSSLMRIPNGIKARSVEIIMQPYADDVYVANFMNYIGVAGPTAPLSLSKGDLRAAYIELFRASKDITMNVKDLRLSVSGSRATAEARTELQLRVEAARREERRQTFVNDVVWRMQRTGGGWKIVEEIWR